VNEIPDISAVDVLAADKVRFTCAFACPDLGPVTLADLPILPEHVWSKVPPGEVKKHAGLPVGTGPYRLVSFDQTTGYRFEANPDHFAGEPLVRELVMPIIADPSATFTALQAGQIDAAFRPECRRSSSSSSAARRTCRSSRPSRCASPSCASTSSAPPSTSRASARR
jgi:peptide/nickel transport system substrate-binding protein